MRRRLAFTLLELLLATVLLCGLMIGVLAVLTRLISPVDIAAQNASPMTADVRAMNAWLLQLRSDLEQAQIIEESQPQHLAMVNYRSLEDEGLLQRHRPVRIQYRIESIRGRSWVVREQAWLDDLSNRNVRRDLVCHSVVGFQLESLRASDAAEAARHSNAESDRRSTNDVRVSQKTKGDSAESGKNQAKLPISVAVQDDTVWHNGLPYFRKQAPAWLIAEARNQQLERIEKGQGIGPASGPSAASLLSSDNKHSLRQDPAAKIRATEAGTLWRLRVSTIGDSTGKSHILMLRRGER